MPTIKGGIKIGKHSTQEDLDKLSKACGKQVFSKHVAAQKPEPKVEVKVEEKVEEEEAE